jgi:hypothetical protein
MSTRGQHWKLCVVIVYAGAADAQPAPRLGHQPPEEAIQLPAIKVRAPVRLPALPLSLSEVLVTVTSGPGEIGPRGLIAAFDAESGKELWRTYTIPAGEPGNPEHLSVSHSLTTSMIKGQREKVQHCRYGARRDPPLPIS